MNEKITKAFKVAGLVSLSVLMLVMFLNILAAGLPAKQISVSRTNLGGGISGKIGSTGLPTTGVQSAPMPLGAPNMLKSTDAIGVAPSPVGFESAGSGVDIPTDKKIIKNGYLTLTVTKADEAANLVTEVARAHQGDVFSSNFSNETWTGTNAKSGTMVIKVPAAEFDATFSELKKIGTQVVNESTSGQDATEQYVDLQAQLQSKQAEEQAFTKILDQAVKIDDVLAVTQQLTRVRGEIDRLQGQIRYLASQTDMASITVSITEDVSIIPVANGWRPWEVMKAAVKQLVKSSQGMIDGVIVFVIVGLPALLIVFLIFWLVFLLIRKIARKFIPKP